MGQRGSARPLQFAAREVFGHGKFQEAGRLDQIGVLRNEYFVVACGNADADLGVGFERDKGLFEFSEKRQLVGRVARPWIATFEPCLDVRGSQSLYGAGFLPDDLAKTAVASANGGMPSTSGPALATVTVLAFAALEL